MRAALAADHGRGSAFWPRPVSPKPRRHYCVRQTPPSLAQLIQVTSAAVARDFLIPQNSRRPIDERFPGDMRISFVIVKFAAPAFLLVALGLFGTTVQAQEPPPADMSTTPVAYQTQVEVDPVSPRPKEKIPAWKLHEGTAGDLPPRRIVFITVFYLTIRGVYDDNINISHTNRTEDYYVAIEPGFSIGLATRMVEDRQLYPTGLLPSIVLFADHDENDAIQHLFHLEAFHRFSRLALTLIKTLPFSTARA